LRGCASDADPQGGIDWPFLILRASGPFVDNQTQATCIPKCSILNRQTVADWHRLRTSGGRASGSPPMSKADQFRQYAEEAMRWARQSKTEYEKLALIELARTWTQAAQRSDAS